MTTDPVPMANSISLASAGENLAPAMAGGAQADLTSPGTKTKLFGRVTAVYFEPKCSTCQDPEREYIERQHLAGDSSPAIVLTLDRTLDDEHKRTTKKDRASARSINRHVQYGHLPRHAMTAAAVLQARTNEMGHDRETFVGNVMNLGTFAKMLHAHVIDKFLRGEMPEVSWSEYGTAANIIQKQDMLLAATDTADVDRVTEMVDVLLEAAANVMTIEQRSEFTRALASYPTVAGFKVRSEGQKRALEERIRAELESGVDGAEPAA